MPTYEYRCKGCQDQFELVQKMSDDPIKNCPSCGGEVKRLIGAGAGIIFKGTGWYQTDFKNSGQPKPAKANGSEGNSSSSSDSSSSGESKSEPKTDTPKKETSSESNKKAAAPAS